MRNVPQQQHHSSFLTCSSPNITDPWHYDTVIAIGIGIVLTAPAWSGTAGGARRAVRDCNLEEFARVCPADWQTRSSDIKGINELCRGPGTCYVVRVVYPD